MIGQIYALDLATKTGFAKGPPGASPTSGSVILKRTDEPQAVAFSNLIAFLQREWSIQCPALVVKERMFSLQASRERNNSEASVLLHAGLHAIVAGMCLRFGIPWDADIHNPAASTIRKHFLGSGRGSSRAETKAAVVARCHLLRLMPADCRDDNRADAIAVHDWACAQLARTSPSELHLFEARKARA